MNGIAVDLETLQHLEENAVKAAGAENVVRFEQVHILGDHKVAQIKNDGTVTILNRETRRMHELANLTALGPWLDYAVIAFAKNDDETDDGETDEDESLTSNMVVWVSQNRVDVVLDGLSEIRPHNGATLNVPYGADFELIKGFAEKSVMYDQKAFVRLLRNTLAENLYPGQSGTLTTVDGGAPFDIKQELVDTFSVLKFETRNRMAGGVSAGADFLGKELASEITSGTTDRPRTVPTSIDLFVSPYRDCELVHRYRIPCEVVIDYEACKLGLAPCLKDIQEVQDAALAEMTEFVNSEAPEGVHVFTGKP